MKYLLCEIFKKKKACTNILLFVSWVLWVGFFSEWMNQGSHCQERLHFHPAKSILIG
jgi:hypothetical protein